MTIIEIAAWLITIAIGVPLAWLCIVVVWSVITACIETLLTFFDYIGLS